MYPERRMHVQQLIGAIPFNVKIYLLGIVHIVRTLRVFSHFFFNPPPQFRTKFCMKNCTNLDPFSRLISARTQILWLFQSFRERSVIFPRIFLPALNSIESTKNAINGKIQLFIIFL